jgi:formate dehydrogenase maturation protein FdhE
MDAKKRDIGKPALRRKSMELLKDITQMLREILSSGDEEGLRQIEKTIRALEQTSHKPDSHSIH